MAPAQVDEEGVFHHLHLDAGKGAREVGQRLRQQVLHHHEGGGHPQQAGELAVAAGHAALDLLGLVGHAAGLVEHQRTGLGGLVAVARALEQPCAEPGFQRVEPAQHRGVVHPQLPGGGRQPAGVAHGQRIAQVAPVQFRHPGLQAAWRAGGRCCDCKFAIMVRRGCGLLQPW